MREVVLEVPQLPFAGVEPGDTVYSGTRGVSVVGDSVDTTGERRIEDVPEYWEERPLLVVEVEGGLAPDAPLTLRCLDLRDQMCSIWWPMVSKLGVDANDNGIAYLDQGGGRTANRNQTGYAKRPDGLYTDRAASTTAAGLRYYSYRNLGLHIEGGSTHSLLNSTFSQWGGGTPTSWTVVTGGTATATQSTAKYICDVSGLQSSLVLTSGGGSNPYVYQTSATWVAGLYGRARLIFESSTVAVPLVLLRRSDGADYNFTTGAWVGGTPGLWTSPLTVGDILDSDADDLIGGVKAGVGPIEWQSPVFIPGGSYDIQMFVGNASGVFNVLYAQLIKSAYVRCPAWPVYPTVGAAVAVLSDAVSISNATAVRCVEEDRGTVELRWRPCMSHADLPDSGSVFLWMSYRQGAAVTNEYDGLWYYRTDASNGKWVFQRNIAGTTTSAEYAVATTALLTAGEEYRLAARWTGTHGELSKDAYTLDLFVDGALRDSAVSGAPGAANNSARIYAGRDAAGLSGEYGGGWFSRLTAQTFCKTDAEIIAGMVV